MLCQPCECLTAGEGLATDVCCRRCILEHRVVAVVLARLAGVGAQTLDAEVAESEPLYLGNVYGSIAVNQVGGRTVGLVAGDGPVAVCPCRPLLGEVLQQQVAQCLAVVGYRLHVARCQFRQVLFQLVAAPFLKLFEEGRGPCGLCHLVGVVEERMRIRCLCAFESLFNVAQVVGYGMAVEVVDDQSFPAGCSALYLHDTIAHIQCYDAPCVVVRRALGSLPCQLPVGHGRSHVDGHVLAIHHDFIQPTVFRVTFRCFQRQTLHGFAHERLVYEDGLVGRFLQGYPWTAKRPSRTSGHVYLDARLLTVSLHLAQHAHPLVGEKRYVISLIALHTIDWGDFHRSNAMVGILLHVPLQVLLVDGRAQPPPSYSRLSLLSGGRPLLGIGCTERTAYDTEKKETSHFVSSL